ncbi:MAG: aldo/keto reductase [Candidatus Eremiobacteraeota bacterium]|nr:aldo/keto reductase [Candidatus Eremiobacteraeota bacterium]
MSTEPGAMAQPLPQRRLGALPVEVGAIGLGGEGILRTFGYDAQAADVINAALDEGITYFDSARAYAGSEQYYGATLGARRDHIFLTSKAHDRCRHGARAMLDQSLANMRISHLDLWQLHDLRTFDELEEISAPGGAYEAFEEAKRAGKTRYIGLTGHYDTDVLSAAIERLRFDSLLIPINPGEGRIGGGFCHVGAKAMDLGMAVIGMKVLARGLLTQVEDPPAIQELIDYSLSQPVHIIIVGCETPEQVRANAHAARNFAPMSDERKFALERRLEPHVADMLYYRPQGFDAAST